MELDTYSPIPLHAQLKEIIRSKIKTESYIDKIPSERALMEQYSVSRTTVREAVSALVREGILEKIHGKGTFINSSPPVNEWLGNLSSVSETIERMGMKPGAKLLISEISSNQKICEILGVNEYYHIERLRYADKEPIAIERHYYNVEIGNRLSQCDLNEISLYAALEERNIILYSAQQKITASVPTKDEAKLLKIPLSTSVLVTERITSDPQGNVVEYYQGIYRADRYAFNIKILRNTYGLGNNLINS